MTRDVLRADARRNRDALLAASAEVFSERGAEASLEEIARRAGVGIGTLYRHFPTRLELVDAVYRHGVQTLCEQVDPLLAEYPPDVAMDRWMRLFADYAVRKRGAIEALREIMGADLSGHAAIAASRELVVTAIGKLVTAAAWAGLIRADIAPEDILRAMHGLCYAAAAGSPSPDPAVSDRLVSLLVDGLRYGATV